MSNVRQHVEMRLNVLRTVGLALICLLTSAQASADADPPVSSATIRVCLEFQSEGRVTQSSEVALARAMEFIGKRRISSIQGIVSTPGAATYEEVARGYVPNDAQIEFTMSRLRALENRIEAFVRERRPQHWSVAALPGGLVPGFGSCPTLIMFNVAPDAALCAGPRCEFSCTDLGCGRAQ